MFDWTGKALCHPPRRKSAGFGENPRDSGAGYEVTRESTQKRGNYAELIGSRWTDLHRGVAVNILRLHGVHIHPEIPSQSLQMTLPAVQTWPPPVCPALGIKPVLSLTVTSKQAFTARTPTALGLKTSLQRSTPDLARELPANERIWMKIAWEIVSPADKLLWLQAEGGRWHYWGRLYRHMVGVCGCVFGYQAIYGIPSVPLGLATIKQLHFLLSRHYIL